MLGNDETEHAFTALFRVAFDCDLIANCLKSDSWLVSMDLHSTRKFCQGKIVPDPVWDRSSGRVAYPYCRQGATRMCVSDKFPVVVHLSVVGLNGGETERVQSRPWGRAKTSACLWSERHCLSRLHRPQQRPRKKSIHHNHKCHHAHTPVQNGRQYQAYEECNQRKEAGNCPGRGPARRMGRQCRFSHHHDNVVTQLTFSSSPRSKSCLSSRANLKI